MSIIESLAEANPDALLADGLEDAIIGFTINTHMPHVAVYDAAKCVEVLMKRDGMTHEEAEEFLEFNTYCAYVGPNGPLYIYTGERHAAEEGLQPQDRQSEHQVRDEQGCSSQAGRGDCARRCCEG